jgi:hypothetical protein
VDNEHRVGLDYYYDNILKNENFIHQIYFSGGYRHTNWSKSDFKGFLAETDINLGVGCRLGESIVYPHAIIEAAIQPKYNERWWENYVRAGAGIKYYPFAHQERENGWKKELLSRFNFYFEWVHNIIWLEDKAPDSVKNDDFRVGVAFSTGGFYNN